MADDEFGDLHPVDSVREWVIEKHEVLKYYVNICRGVRRIFSGFAESSYIDLYSGSGLCVIKPSQVPIPGSPLAACQAARSSGAPFNRVFVADKSARKSKACAERLIEQGFAAQDFAGDSADTARMIIEKLRPNGFHFAFLDPYSLDLSFDVLRAFQQLKHVDLLVHVSEMDIQRNLEMELADDRKSRLEYFAPGWREHIDLRQPKRAMSQQYLNYWAELVQSIGWNRPPQVRAVKNTRNRRIYHLALLSQNDDVAAKFWQYAVKADVNQSELF
jgi:three-Cys-motif partner protein